jgi:ubiquitin C-terminal hydrolase
MDNKLPWTTKQRNNRNQRNNRGDQRFRSSTNNANNQTRARGLKQKPKQNKGGPKRRRTAGRGLKNLNNTCYLNTATQCVLAVPSIRAECRNHSESCPIKLQSKFCILCAFQRYTVESDFTTGCTTPYELVDNLREWAPEFRPRTQNDVHECLKLMVDGFQKTQKQAQDTSSIQSLVTGNFCSRLTCLECQSYSEKVEPFEDLSLLPKAVSVEQALHEYTAVTLIPEYYCNHCKCYQQHSKQMTIQQLPAVLCIHINRFEVLPPPIGNSKVQGHVKFSSTMNMDPYLSKCQSSSLPASPDSTYVLHAVGVHRGESKKGGHYFSFVRKNKKWLLFDDSAVNVVSASKVFQAQAYMLMYERVSSPPGFIPEPMPLSASPTSLPSLGDHPDIRRHPSATPAPCPSNPTKVAVMPPPVPPTSLPSRGVHSSWVDMLLGHPYTSYILFVLTNLNLQLHTHTHTDSHTQTHTQTCMNTTTDNRSVFSSRGHVVEVAATSSRSQANTTKRFKTYTLISRICTLHSVLTLWQGLSVDRSRSPILEPCKLPLCLWHCPQPTTRMLIPRYHHSTLLLHTQSHS